MISAHAHTAKLFAGRTPPTSLATLVGHSVMLLCFLALVGCGGGSSGGGGNGSGEDGNSGVNTPPTISSISNQTTNQGTAVGPISFTVGDAETPAADLTLSGGSSNTSLVPMENIVFGGAGENRTITITPSDGASGETTISVTVLDGGGLSATTSFLLTVTSGGDDGGGDENTPPTISSIDDQTTSQGTAVGPISFTVGDVETPAADLTLSGGSSNTSLVPMENIVFGGTGENRTITITPSDGASGETTISVTVHDGDGLSATASFLLTVTSGGDDDGGDEDSPPTISSIADQSTTPGTAVGPLSFIIGDAQTAADNLQLSVETSHPGLLPLTNISLGGSGTNRTMSLAPLDGQVGATTIRITVENDAGLTAETSFLLTVASEEPEDTPPTISSIANQTTAQSTQLGPISFTIGDAETPVDDLIVSVQSSNTSLLPLNHISLGGSGANRTITLTPLGDEIGKTTITVTVVNALGLTASRSFTLEVMVIGGSVDFTKKYVIIDISAGPDAVTYPVTESDTAPEDLNSDLYKTDRIVLRRIPAGTFTMGSPEGELGRGDNEGQREVTLSKNYYMGVFQITQRQWMNVMGNENPALIKGDTHPVERVHWNQARGGTWNGGSGGHSSIRSFVGLLTEKSAIHIDLPTEAQWEYAARAGTTTALNSGENLTTATGICPNLEKLGRHGETGVGRSHAPVGSYTPNAWGLYDMHGNVAEWCLDWYSSNLGSSPLTDPGGPNSGSNRVARGGEYRDDARNCRSASRKGSNPEPWSWIYSGGLRIAAFAEHPGGGGNSRPSITNIAHHTTTEGTPIGPIAFTVGDAETPVGDLVMRGLSSNTPLLRNSDISFGGSGAQRTVTLNPRSGASGATTITLTVEDEGGLTNETTFVLTVISNSFVDGRYIIIDISEGPDADSYPVQEMDTLPENLNTELYKTDRIVLRHIPAGTFMMGSPEDEFGSRVVAAQDNEDLHQVTLSDDYYFGVFAVTQRQYEHVMGYNPVENAIGVSRPVGSVNWETVRGGTWDGSAGGDPAPGTFIGRLSAKTGIDFDLPTDAQWEYAARAGTTSAIYTGGDITNINICPVMNLLAHYWGTAGANPTFAIVGSYRPNNWGLYDIYGNVTEWCLDWYQAKLGYESVTDPVGPASGMARVTRGGGTGVYALGQRSASRDNARPHFTPYSYRGFRLAITLPSESDG